MPFRSTQTHIEAIISEPLLQENYRMDYLKY